jgi:hypothetical protein
LILSNIAFYCFFDPLNQSKAIKRLVTFIPIDSNRQ